MYLSCSQSLTVPRPRRICQLMHMSLLYMRTRTLELLIRLVSRSTSEIRRRTQKTSAADP